MPKLQSALTTFVKMCAGRNIRVGISSWYQDDSTHAGNYIPKPGVDALQWAEVLKVL